MLLSSHFISVSKRIYLVSAFLVFLCVSGMAFAASNVFYSISVASPWAKATPQGNVTTAVYLTFLNTTNEEDFLVGAETPIAEKVEIRDTSKDNIVQDKVSIHPSETMVFQPGGIHLVLIGLKDQLVPRTKFPLTLKFEKSPPTNTMVQVLAPGEKLKNGIDENRWQ